MPIFLSRKGLAIGIAIEPLHINDFADKPSSYKIPSAPDKSIRASTAKAIATRPSADQRRRLQELCRVSRARVRAFRKVFISKAARWPRGAVGGARYDYGRRDNDSRDNLTKVGGVLKHLHNRTHPPPPPAGRASTAPPGVDSNLLISASTRRAVACDLTSPNLLYIRAGDGGFFVQIEKTLKNLIGFETKVELERHRKRDQHRDLDLNQKKTEINTIADEASSVTVKDVGIPRRHNCALSAIKHFKCFIIV
ncbi:hypothetical protein EVAR_35993_1 [Eumeta japonica]|uniref:Uncharacterized protein n=1 Tax=Eumeta variegata TaxID=151549 RepID=A0A4C1WSH4_EUMVA|nr:hypothetical protein EVAR_35993_1 [Eumeta japonica]